MLDALAHVSRCRVLSGWEKKKRGGSGKENDGQTYVFVDQFDKLSAVKGPITGNHSLKQQNFKVAHEGTITCSSFSVILRQEKKKKKSSNISYRCVSPAPAWHMKVASKSRLSTM